MPTLPLEVAQHSVQQRAADFGIDQNPLSMFFYLGQTADDIAKWWSPQRDIDLRNFWPSESIMAGAVYSMTAKMKSLTYTIEGPKSTAHYFQDLLANAEFGKGWSHLMSKVVEDHLCTDRGAFIELIRKDNDDPHDRIIGLAHLDALQCTLTGNLAYPVIYTNQMSGRSYLLADHQVIHFPSMPSPIERYKEVGLCAVSRALKASQIIRDIVQYKREKLSSRPPRGIIYATGITKRQLQQAVDDANKTMDDKGLQRFGEFIVTAALDPSAQVDIKMLEFASLPDGYNEEQAITLYVYILAMAFGVDAREFWPAATTGATKADALVQAAKARGKGPGDIITSLERRINWKVLPKSCTFRFDFVDDDEDKAKEDIKTAKTSRISSMYVGSPSVPGYISRDEARQLAVDEKLIPEEFITVDVTDKVVLDDVDRTQNKRLDSSDATSNLETDNSETADSHSAD